MPRRLKSSKKKKSERFFIKQYRLLKGRQENKKAVQGSFWYFEATAKTNDNIALCSLNFCNLLENITYQYSINIALKLENTIQSLGYKNIKIYLHSESG